MKLMKAWLSARNDLESRFHLCGGLVKLVKTCLSARKDRESRFHRSGGLVKLVQVCLSCLLYTSPSPRD